MYKLKEKKSKNINKIIKRIILIFSILIILFFGSVLIYLEFFKKNEKKIEIKNLNIQIDILNKELNFKKNEIKNLNIQIDILNKELVYKETEIDNKEIQVNILKNQLVENQNKNNEFNDKESEINEIIIKINFLKNELNEKKDEIIILKNKLLKSENEATKWKLKDNKNEILKKEAKLILENKEYKIYKKFYNEIVRINYVKNMKINEDLVVETANAGFNFWTQRLNIKKIIDAERRTITLFNKEYILKSEIGKYIKNYYYDRLQDIDNLEKILIRLKVDFNYNVKGIFKTYYSIGFNDIWSEKNYYLYHHNYSACVFYDQRFYLDTISEISDKTMDISVFQRVRYSTKNKNEWYNKNSHLIRIWYSPERHGINNSKMFFHKNGNDYNMTLISNTTASMVIGSSSYLNANNIFESKQNYSNNIEETLSISGTWSLE